MNNDYARTHLSSRADRVKRNAERATLGIPRTARRKRNDKQPAEKTAPEVLQLENVSVVPPITQATTPPAEQSSEVESEHVEEELLRRGENSAGNASVVNEVVVETVVQRVRQARQGRGPLRGNRGGKRKLIQRAPTRGFKKGRGGNGKAIPRAPTRGFKKGRGGGAHRPRTSPKNHPVCGAEVERLGPKDFVTTKFTWVSRRRVRNFIIRCVERGHNNQGAWTTARDDFVTVVLD